MAKSKVNADIKSKEYLEKYIQTKLQLVFTEFGLVEKEIDEMKVDVKLAMENIAYCNTLLLQAEETLMYLSNYDTLNLQSGKAISERLEIALERNMKLRNRITDYVLSN